MITDFINIVSSTVMGNIVMILGLILALVCCFNGFKLFKILIKFYGFIIFLSFGTIIGSLLGASGQTLSIIGLCFGFVGLFLSYKFYKGMVVLAVSYQTLIILSPIITSTIIVGIISIVVGFLSTNFIKPIVSITTATSSAVIISTLLVILMPFASPFELFITIGFSIAGIVKQLSK